MWKRKLLKYLCPIGALMSGICYFLPWVKVSSIYSLSGIERGGALWILIALILVIVTSFIVALLGRRSARYALMAASILGVMMMIAVFYRVWTAEILFVDVKSIFDVKLQPAGIGMSAGYIFAFVGSMFMRNSKTDDE